MVDEIGANPLKFGSARTTVDPFVLVFLSLSIQPFDRLRELSSPDNLGPPIPEPVEGKGQGGMMARG